MLEERFSSQLRARSDSGDYVVNDAQLTNYLQNPGTIPSFMVLAEIERRQAEKVRREQAQAQPQQPTVKDQAIMALGQQMPQGMAMPPEQVAMAPEQRAGSGIAALNPPVQMAEGGIVGYAVGDLVKRKLFAGRSLGDMYADPEGMYADSYLQNLQEARLRKDRPPTSRDGTPYPSSLIGEPTEEAVLAAGKERMEKKDFDIPGGYVPKESNLKSEEQIKEEIEAQQEKDKKAAQDKLLSDKDKTFEGAKLDTGKFNTMPYDELMIENPVEYGRTLKEELRAELGEDDYKKLEKEQLGDLDKRIGSRDSKKWSMAALITGAKMLSSKDPYFAGGLGEGLEAGAGFLTQEQKEIEALKSQRLDIQTKLRIADRKEKEALNKFGAQSEQFARANNMKVSLEQQSNMLKQREIDIKEPYYSGLGQAYKGMSAETSLADKKFKALTEIVPARDLVTFNKLKQKIARGEKLEGKEKKVYEDTKATIEYAESLIERAYPAGKTTVSPSQTMRGSGLPNPVYSVDF
jgi:hypothetical protein